MVNILSIDASAEGCSAALHQNGALIAEKQLFEAQAAAGQLTILIEHVLTVASIKMHELSAVAVGKGPGSYTGLRIATSMAKGLCFALEIPLIAVHTLEAMASGQTFGKHTLMLPMLDARRKEVYVAGYQSDSMLPVLETDAMILEETSFVDLSNQYTLVAFGPGSAKVPDIVKTAIRIIPDVLPAAKHMGILALEKYKSGHFEDITLFEPYYLKEFYTTAKLI